MNIIFRVAWLCLLLLTFQITLMAQSSKINGVVSDAVSGLPLAGATILNKIAGKEVLTDQKGNFSIDFIPGKHQLIITYTGYQERNILPESENFLNILLTPSNKQLDEVVVVGYGTQKRKELIGAVSKIDPSETKTIPAGGFDAQLQGKAPGVQISSNTGVPGEAVTIRLRGATSINAAGNAPGAGTGQGAYLF